MDQKRIPISTARGMLPGTIALLGLLTWTAPGLAAPGSEPQPKAAATSTPKPDVLPTVGEKTAGLERHEGLLNLYFDRARGKLWVEVPPATGPGGEVGQYLYVEGLLSGVGSNPVGLDRGQIGATRLVSLRRLGGRLLLEEQNLGYRAQTEDPLEQRAVRQSFATSVLWAGPVAALDPDGRALADFTSFAVRDAHGVAATLKSTGQGVYSLDEPRSALDLDACLAFPENIELEALLTFAGSEPGPEMRATVPSPQSVSLVQHHSLLKLPPPGYTPRRFDPRSGNLSISFLDYAKPLDQPIETSWLVRHRLEKQDPKAERSPVKKPIVYYVDPGTPEPVRTALLEGARWWSRAFEEAGFHDAFRVELLPEGAHPLDARYNVIQWVHRSTRGWSYGGGVVDPRTGERIKGHVTLGSLRVRQDRLLFEGLLGTDGTGTGGPRDPVQLALARIRQLAAHEVGHALGLSHNFAASTYAGRASVMDYPAPLIHVTQQGDLDLSEAYGVGVGVWDVQAIRYAYSEFAPGTDEAAALEKILQDGLKRGYLFLSDADARPAGASHPLANLWDNGDDPIDGLEQALRVRQIALSRFGEKNVRPGVPLAHLQEVLAPLYFHHRYELDAAVKEIGGMTYAYALRGDGQPPARPVDGATQRRALAAVLGVLSPETLDLPEPVLGLLLPRPLDEEPNREMFGGRSAPAFDAIGAAATAADMAVRDLLQPERMARLVDFHRRDPGLPGLEEVLDALHERVFTAQKPRDEREAEIVRATQRVMVDALIDRAVDPAVPSQVRFRLLDELQKLRRLREEPSPDRIQHAHLESLRSDLERFFERESPERVVRPAPAEPPPGQPIGSMAQDEEGCSFAP
jgi:uncharacterized protein DUF4953/uncharacterized protein DUF5117